MVLPPIYSLTWRLWSEWRQGERPEKLGVEGKRTRSAFFESWNIGSNHSTCSFQYHPGWIYASFHFNVRWQKIGSFFWRFANSIRGKIILSTLSHDNFCDFMLEFKRNFFMGKTRENTNDFFMSWIFREIFSQLLFRHHQLTVTRTKTLSHFSVVRTSPGKNGWHALASSSKSHFGVKDSFNSFPNRSFQSAYDETQQQK